MELPTKGDKYTLDEVEVIVTDVRKRGRGYYVTWEDAPQPYVTEQAKGRTRFKDWQRKAVAA
jgi:hypothetical protein